MVSASNLLSQDFKPSQNHMVFPQGRERLSPQLPVTGPQELTLKGFKLAFVTIRDIEVSLCIRLLVL